MLFGNRLAPLSRVLPSLQQSGRNDPVAMLGRSLASRTNQKKMQKAEKDMAKGKNKSIDGLEAGIQWVSLSANIRYGLEKAYISRCSSLSDKPLQRR